MDKQKIAKELVAVARELTARLETVRFAVDVSRKKAAVGAELPLSSYRNLTMDFLGDLSRYVGAYQGSLGAILRQTGGKMKTTEEATLDLKGQRFTHLSHVQFDSVEQAEAFAEEASPIYERVRDMPDVF